MVILTDVLIASTSEAEAICADPQHHVRWPCLQWRNIDSELFGDLLAALGKDDDAKALRTGKATIYSSDASNSCVIHLTDTLPALLAKLDDENIPEVAKRWAQAITDVRVEEDGPIVQALTELRDFSRQAVAANKPLLLWIGW